MKLPRLLSRLGFVLLCCCAVRLAAAEAPTKRNGYTVMVEIKITEDGKVESVALLDSDDTSAGEVLSKMALAMAMNTKIPPRIKDGKPVKTTVRAPFFFPIDDDEGEESNHGPKPKVKDAIQPAYPLSLREKGVVGGAILELVVDATGKLSRLTTLRASHPEFEAAARESLQKWTFTAAQQNGQSVESRTRIAITFETEETMADVKWRIPPRPRLGSLTVIRPNEPIPGETPDPAPVAPTPAPAPAK